MSDLKRIYILSADDYEALVAWHTLHNLGYTPYCPNLNKVATWQQPVCDLEEHNHQWLRACDAVYRVMETDDEETLALAEQLGLPIIGDINDLERRGTLRVFSA